MKNSFNKDYFESGIEHGLSCYSNYRWIPELTIPMCSVMISHLGIEEDQTVLDYGCAKGYSVKAMRLLHREAFGVDISQYAIGCAPTEVRDYLSLLPEDGNIPHTVDWTIAKDVLEHVPYEDIPKTLDNIRKATRKLFVIVPLGADGKYVVPAYELDVTHKIREPLNWWVRKLHESGFLITEASYRVKHIKENWAQWEKGNGFIVCDEHGR